MTEAQCVNDSTIRYVTTSRPKRCVKSAGSVSAYADDIPIIVTKEGRSIEEYETADGANINPEMSVRLQFGTQRGKSMPFDCVVGAERRSRLISKGSVPCRLLDRKELGRSLVQGDPVSQDLVREVAILERESCGDEGIYCIGHHIPPLRRSLL